MKIITAKHIRRWGEDRLDARAILPQLIRRLIHATIDGITHIDFPAFESTQHPGFDGTLASTMSNAWIPKGVSCWELSVQGSVKGKAAKDFAKRRILLTKAEKKARTFVFATARYFRDKKTWAKSKTKSAGWKRVIALDADDLEQWLEHAPGVAIWFAQVLDLRPEGVDSVESRWNALADSTLVRLQPELFLTSRNESVKRFAQWLSSPPSCLTVTSRSPTEATDFAVASLIALPENERESKLSRAIIVETHSAWKTLLQSEGNQILLLDASIHVEPAQIAKTISNGNHVLVATSADCRNLTNSFELERASEYELSQCLEKCGITAVKAEQLARASAGSLAILKRRLSRYPDSYRPRWTDAAPSQVLSTCLLLGGWDENVAADLAAFESLAGIAYSTAQANLQLLAAGRDPLLIYAAKKWRVISKDEAWDVLQSHISASVLETFVPIATEILCDDDPKLQLKPDERFLASIKGHTPKYSPTIKSQIAETIAALGTFGDSMDAAPGINVEAVVGRLIAGVLSPDVTWHRWASLGSRLSLLAEASPRTFLDALELSIDRSPHTFTQLLSDEGHPLFAGCNHSGMLWALETLAWHPEFLFDVCRLLTRLHALDRGGQWSNRPKASLQEILSYWMPHTTADLPQRINSMDAIVSTSIDAAWQILIAQLPSATGGFSTPTHRPRWRDWANSWTRGKTFGEIRAIIQALSERLLQTVGDSVQRWNELIEHCDQLSCDTIADMISRLKNLAQLSKLTDDDRRLLSEQLAEKLELLRRYTDETASFSKTDLQDLEQALTLLAPKSVAMRHVWLFTQWPNRLLFDEDSYEDRQNAIQQRRERALQEIIEALGISGVLELGRLSDAPGLVGSSLAVTTGDDHEDEILPRFLCETDVRRDIAFGFVRERYRSGGWTFVDKVLARCSTDDERCWLLAFVPFSEELYRRITAMAPLNQRTIWQRLPVHFAQVPSTIALDVLNALLEVGRFAEAIDLSAMLVHTDKSIDSECLLRPLEALLVTPPDQLSADALRRLSHDIRSNIGELQQRNDVDIVRLASLEWNFLRFLDDHSGHAPITLQRMLAENPKNYVDMLVLSFKGKNEESRADKATPEDRINARLAFQLINGWKTVPGTNADGIVNEAVLSNWVNDVRAAAQAVDRLEICDDRVGHLLANSPFDADGSWPCAPVRSVLEAIHTKQIAAGFRCGVLNSRGVICRGRGGDQERELIKKYKGFNNAIRHEWPFVARILDDIVESYRHEAKSWDEDERWEE